MATDATETTTSDVNEASGAEEGEGEAVTETDAETLGEEDTGAVAIAKVAWWRAARRRFLSFSDGPRWRVR